MGIPLLLGIGKGVAKGARKVGGAVLGAQARRIAKEEARKLAARKAANAASKVKRAAKIKKRQDKAGKATGSKTTVRDRKTGEQSLGKKGADNLARRTSKKPSASDIEKARHEQAGKGFVKPRGPSDGKKKVFEAQKKIVGSHNKARKAAEPKPKAKAVKKPVRKKVVKQKKKLKK